VNGKWAQIVKIDATGKTHRTIHQTQWKLWTVIQAHSWGGRWAGPKGSNYALDTVWDCYKLEDLREATISSLHQSGNEGTIQATRVAGGVEGARN
jgi:hypothetical protein